MSMPEDGKRHKNPTIILGHAIAERVDPLDESWLILEGLLRELLEGDQIVYGDEEEVEVGSTWAS